MLQFNTAWRYDSPGEISPEVINDFSDIITKLSRGEQRPLEHFKRYFATAAGMPPSWSSDASWAATDLYNYMEYAAKNAPMFIEAFYDACEDLTEEHSNIPAPDVQIINRILAKHNSKYQIQEPNVLVADKPHIVTPLKEIPLSLDQQAREVIQTSFKEAEKLISEGRHRPAVQELLWLLETVTTAFQGIHNAGGSIEGKYFNKIIGELKLANRGKTFEVVTTWITNLHGYLSAPAGGGIRHGMHLKEGVATSQNEAQLYCNLITSYISFLLAEYDRLHNT